MSDRPPIIGITPDVAEPKPGTLRLECSLAYCRAVLSAGGMPIVLPPFVELIPLQLEACDGFVLTGGDDPRTESFGAATHPAAKPMHTARQEYEVALLRALESRSDTPVLGVCLGMQLMALCAGGTLNQHMPDDVPSAAAHAGNSVHAVRIVEQQSVLGSSRGGSPITIDDVTSHHRQAVKDPGRLRVIARAPDGIIEAVDDPARPFVLGVQWHPERTANDAAGAAIFRRLVEAARTAR